MSFVRYHRLGSLFGSTDNPDIMKYHKKLETLLYLIQAMPLCWIFFQDVNLQMLHEWFVSARQRPPAIMLHL